MIEERLQKPGAFTVPLVEDTPASLRTSIRNNGVLFGHVFVTPVRVSAGVSLTLANLQAQATYCGIVNRLGVRTLQGVGLLAYFDWLTRMSSYVDGPSTVTYAPGAGPGPTFSTWMTTIIDATTQGGNASPLSSGTITAIAGNLEWNRMFETRREELDYVCGYFGGEYKVNVDGTIDAGPASSLFVTTPTVIVLPRGGVRDISRTGLQALQLEQEIDYEDVATHVVIVGDSNSVEELKNTSIVPDDLNGNPLLITKVIDTPTTNTLAIATVAAQELAKALVLRRTTRVVADDYSLRSRVEPGDTVYVYDPDQFLFDTANQVTHGGQVIFPVALRAVGLSWPLQEGMGVYYRISETGVVHDLTDYVAWEDGGTTVEVGALPRPLTPGPDNLALQGRAIGF